MQNDANMGGLTAMRPEYWQPSIELSTAEVFVIQRIKRAKLFDVSSLKSSLLSFQRGLEIPVKATIRGCSLYPNVREGEISLSN